MEVLNTIVDLVPCIYVDHKRSTLEILVSIEVRCDRVVSNIKGDL